MTDIALDTTVVTRADERVESPMRRALRRLKRRKCAVVGLVVIALFVMTDISSNRYRVLRVAQESILRRLGRVRR